MHEPTVTPERDQMVAVATNQDLGLARILDQDLVPNAARRVEPDARERLSQLLVACQSLLRRAVEKVG
jgi:hypothetical protein